MLRWLGEKYNSFIHNTRVGNYLFIIAHSFVVMTKERRKSFEKIGILVPLPVAVSFLYAYGSTNLFIYIYKMTISEQVNNTKTFIELDNEVRTLWYIMYFGTWIFFFCFMYLISITSYLGARIHCKIVSHFAAGVNFPGFSFYHIRSTIDFFWFSMFAFGLSFFAPLLYKTKFDVVAATLEMRAEASSYLFDISAVIVSLCYYFFKERYEYVKYKTEDEVFTIYESRSISARVRQIRALVFIGCLVVAFFYVSIFL